MRYSVRRFGDALPGEQHCRRAGLLLQKRLCSFGREVRLKHITRLRKRAESQDEQFPTGFPQLRGLRPSRARCV